MPINKNNAVQTGANIQLGGLKGGFIIPAYHVPIEGAVKIEPISPAPSQINIEVINLNKFFINSLYQKKPAEADFIKPSIID